jgi:hypothetical protein
MPVQLCMLEKSPLGFMSVGCLLLSIDSVDKGKNNQFLGVRSASFFIDKPLYRFSACTA